MIPPVFSICYFLFAIISTVASKDYLLQSPLQVQILPSETNNLGDIHQSAATLPFSHEFGKANRHLSELTTNSLSSVIGQVFSPINISVLSMTISNDSNTAFLATSFDRNRTCEMKVLNITDLESPHFLGSIPFTLSADEMKQVQFGISTVDFLPSIILSHDQLKLFMPVGPYIQVIDISNLASPVHLGSYKSPGTCSIYSNILSPDGETMFTLNMNCSSQHQQVEAVNLTDILLPNQTSTLIKILDNANSQIQLDLGRQLFFVGLPSKWQVYNITDYEKPIGVLDFNTLNRSDPKCSISDLESVVFYDSHLAFCVSLYCVMIVNISNLTAPTVLPNSIFLGGYGDYQPVLSPDGKYFYTDVDNALQVFDVSNPSFPVLLSQINMPFSSVKSISPDGKIALAANAGQLYLAQLYLGIETNQVFSHRIAEIEELVPYDYDVALLSTNNTLYITAAGNSLEVKNVSNPASPRSLPSFNLKENAPLIAITPDQRTLVTATDTINSPILVFYDIESGNQISNFYGFNHSSNQSTKDFRIKNYVTSLAISRNGDIAFILNTEFFWINNNNQKLHGVNFLIVNISDISQPSLLANISNLDNSTEALTVSQDGNTVFLGATNLTTYDVSNPSSPTVLSTFRRYSPLASIPSPDGNTLYILAFDDFESKSLLQIVNISSLTSPIFITELIVPSNNTPIFLSYDLMDISPDGMTLFLAAGGLTIVDVSDQTSPVIIDYYGCFNPVSLLMSPDYSTAYLVDQGFGVDIINLKPEYIFNLPSDNFLLGQSSSNTLNVLTRNPQNTYDANLANYKFVKLSLYSLQFQYGYTKPISTYTILPDWIDFDLTTGILSLNPNSQVEVGRYSVYGAVSKQLDNMAFNGTGNIRNSRQAAVLVNNLISLGYLDNEGFLTSQFDPNHALRVGSEPLPNELEIRKIMAKYYIEAITTIYVSSSLVLTASPKFVVSTLSVNPLTINITLANSSLLAQFVQRSYSVVPSYGYHQSSISMVGSVVDINTALSQLTIFLNGTDFCDGTIAISDGLNPPINQYFNNISQYFTISSQPQVNNAYFQTQLDKVSISTGEQFIIQFDYSTFIDPDGEDLTYALLMQESGVSVSDWITLRGLDLIGTPPDQLTGRDIPLKIVASNEYQSTEVEFTLHVSISALYALKLASTCVSGLITLLGLIFYAPQIYNIFCKRLYRYPKDFFVPGREGITPWLIYPVSFIAEPLTESRFILKQLDRKIAKEIKSDSKSNIAAYFTVEETCQIDHYKLIKTIGEVIEGILNGNNSKHQSQLKLSIEGPDSRRELINLLIINEVTLRLLDLKKEVQTKNAFDAIKKHLFDFVDLVDYSEEDGVCQFSVNKPKLLRELQTHNLTQKKKTRTGPIEINHTAEMSHCLNTSEDHVHSSLLTSSMETHFISSSEANLDINMKLLVDVIQAYAFKYHHLDVESIDVKIEAREKLAYLSPPRIIRRFLKKDLQLIEFAGKGNVIGYGIMYEVCKGYLRFSGTTHNDIKDKVIVVQIKNLGGRILREIWINGVNYKEEENR